jgi:hypothetical protein
MPKNVGAGLVLPLLSERAGVLRTLVRLGRRDLWQRLDRNMISRYDGGRRLAEVPAVAAAGSRSSMAAERSRPPSF